MLFEKKENKHKEVGAFNDFNWPTPASFLFIFSFFNQTLQFYSKSMWKMSIQDPVPGIQTHNPPNSSLLP